MLFRKFIFLFFFCFMLVLTLCGNNLNLGNAVRIISVSDERVTFEINVSWSNSWRDGYNNDAAWIFFKYRPVDGDWAHVLLNDDVKVDDGYGHFIGRSAGEGVGLLLFRSGVGNGNASSVCRVSWDFTSVGLTAEQFRQNKVFLMAQGVEMVYIPFGSFALGDGESDYSFIAPGSASSPTPNLVTGNGSEDPVVIEIKGSSGVRNIDGLYPSGYSGFYIMKYELSQEQYVAFFNTLTRGEQQKLLPWLSSLKKGDYVFGSCNAPSRRNGIIVSVPLSDGHVAVLDNNLNNNGTYGAPDDGRTLACNYLSIRDMLAYMSWSGLRPLAETEYEKACRRFLPSLPVAGEYAWGNTSFSGMSDIVAETAGWNSETPGNGNVNGQGLFGSFPGRGPVRCGAFAAIATNRQEAGATYSGVMEMSGNLSELCVNASRPAIAFFDGSVHGNGDYLADEWDRPSVSYFGVRGGSFASDREELRISDRSHMESGYFSSLDMRDSTVGFRGVRMLDFSELQFDPGTLSIDKPVVCSGESFVIKGTDAFVTGLSGLFMRYTWYMDGTPLAYETGRDLSVPAGLFNTAKEEKQYSFVRRVSCSVGDYSTKPFIISVPGKLTVSLPEGVGELRMACNVTATVTASREGDCRFRWLNASDNRVVKEWSSARQADSYTPLHKDFGYMGAIRKLRCISDVSGCRDSMDMSFFIEPSCFLTLDSATLHMTTNTDGGTAVASLCGPGTVQWYYKDDSGTEHLIGTATASPMGTEIIPLSYVTAYKPRYSDFKNTIGQKTVVVRSALGDDSHCTDTRELIVDVKATLDPGKISAPSLACGNTEITVNNQKDAGVEGMAGFIPVYYWYVNGSSTPLANENKATLKYRLPANTADRAVAHTFVRKAVTAAPSLQTPYGDTVVITVPGVPAVTITAPAAVCDNTNLALTAPLINWAGLNGSGAWSLNGGGVPSPVRYANNGQELLYTISNTCHSSVKSNGIAITVYPPTLITTQPVGQTLCQAGTISLSVAATGRELKYQWQKNSVNIGGATSASYSKGGAIPGDGGSYRCIVTGTCGSITSSAVTVTVHPTTVISAQPSAQTLCQGGTISLSTSAVGNGLSYQWQKNGGNIGTGSSYSKGGAVPNDGGTYRCIVTGTCGSATTNAVTVTVNTPTVITSQPSARTLCQGNTISLSTTATGTNISYQWQKNGGNIGTGSSYSKGGAVPGDGGNYRCIVTGTCGNATTNTVTVTVNASTVITSQPSAQTLCQGGTISLSTAATGTNISYQWQKNSGNIASGSSYSKGGAIPGDGGSYRCYITGTCGSVYTNTVNVTVNAPVVSAGSISASTSNVCTNVSFSVNNSSGASSTCGFGITNYEWYRNGSYVGSGVSLGTQTLGNGTYSYYRRAYVSTGAYANSNTVTVTVASCCPATAPGGERVAQLCDGKCWMVQNLNNSSKGSCYQNVSSYCASDGRLYTWSEALNICPSGWHLPSQSEFRTLNNCFDKGAWNPQYAGYYRSDDRAWDHRGKAGNWWASSGSNVYDTHWLIYVEDSKLSMLDDGSLYKFSVRCVQN